MALTACSNNGVKTVHPHRGAIQKTFTALAKTRLSKIYTINMPFTEKLARVNLKAGSLVKKGEVVAKVNQENVQQTINWTIAAIKSAQVSYENERLKLKRATELKKKNYVSQAEVDNIATQAKVYLAQIYQNDAILKMAQYHAKISILKSPVDGVVLKRFTQGGKWLQQGEQILQLGRDKDLEAVADVLTQDAQLLKIGDEVVLTSIENPAVIHGKIKRVEPEGFTKKSALGVDEQRVNVIMTVPNPQKANLGVAYRLQAKFLVGDNKKNVLLVPRFSVLQNSNGNYYVMKDDGGQLKKQIVQIGIANDTEIEITQGLTEKDLIVEQPTAD